MSDKYYSEFISEEFYEKISALRIAKGIKCFEQFEFVFVNSKECECKNVKENNLKTTKVDDDILANITNIVVLGYGEWKNGPYNNVKYTFIGIFDMNGNESSINLGSIELNTISLCQNYWYQTKDVSSCNITISHKQFNNYLNKVSSPIFKTIYPSLEKHTGKCFKQEIKLTMNIIPITNCNLPVWAFGTVLQALKWFEQSLNHNLEDTEFDPEITLKQEITFKIKSSEIQF